MKAYTLRTTFVGDGLLTSRSLDNQLTNRRHTRIAALTGTDGQRLTSLIPVEWNHGESTLFEVIVVALVLIKLKMCIAPRIDIDGQRQSHLSIGVLRHLCRCNNAAGPDV